MALTPLGLDTRRQPGTSRIENCDTEGNLQVTQPDLEFIELVCILQRCREQHAGLRQMLNRS